MQLILQTANVTADAKNCSYPNKVTVTNASELQEAVKMDHVCAKYKNNYRSIDNFLKSNVVVMDLDNDHTDDPDEWITAEKLEELLPDISYAVMISPSNTDNSLILLMLSFSFHILIFKVRCQSLCHHTYCDEDVT